MNTIRKGQYVKSMNGISPSDFANRVGRVVGILNYDGNRDIVVLMLDEPGKVTKTFEDDTLQVISKKVLKSKLKFLKRFSTGKK